jgi:nucleotide-binding universal stress UspA family protein
MNAHPTDLVVGIDGSATALAAARWAATMATQRRRGLRLVHAVEELLVPYPHAGPDDEDLQAVVGARAQRLLEEAGDAVTAVAPGLRPELIQRPEHAADALLAESATAGMVVLGSPGARSLGRVLLGSVSVALAAHAECPVALARPHVAEDEPPTEGPVVVGIDGTRTSEDAIAAAFEEASWRGAPLTAVHCWRDGVLAAVFAEGRWPLDRAAVEQHEHEVLGQRLAGWQEKYPDVVVSREVLPGNPAERLLELADRACLLVVGSRGRSGLAGLALGSTSQAVMSYALCPVLVVRGRTRSDAK